MRFILSQSYIEIICKALNQTMNNGNAGKEFFILKFFNYFRIQKPNTLYISLELSTTTTADIKNLQAQITALAGGVDNTPGNNSTIGPDTIISKINCPSSSV